MKILVTGAAGFIGSHLVRTLVKDGHFCRCLVRKTSNIKQLSKLNNIELWYGDVTNRESLKDIAKDIEIVYHLAAIGHVTAVSRKIRQLYKVNNLEGTRNLIEECLNHNIKRFIFFSSTAAMGTLKLPVVDESTKCKPRTPHQRSKYEVEQLIIKYWKQKQLPAIILRPCMVYGCTAKGDFFKIVKWVYRGILPKIGRGKNLTPIVHVDDVVQAAVLAMHKGRIGEAYIIAGDKSYELDEIRRIILDALGIRRPYPYMPVVIAKMIAILCEMLGGFYGCIPMVNRINIESTAIDRVFSIDKARHELGYEPKVKLEDGIKQTIEWLKENGYI